MSEKDITYFIRKILIRMAEYYPSRDLYNVIVWPLPIIKRNGMCLQHFVQSLLTFDPYLVDRMGKLSKKVMKD